MSKKRSSCFLLALFHFLHLDNYSLFHILLNGRIPKIFLKNVWTNLLPLVRFVSDFIELLRKSEVYFVRITLRKSFKHCRMVMFLFKKLCLLQFHKIFQCDSSSFLIPASSCMYYFYFIFLFISFTLIVHYSFIIN